MMLFMRLRFGIIIILCSVMACNQGTKSRQDNQNSQETEEKAKKNISKRDYSITAANSYSDIFLDSNSLVKFIQAQQVNDTLARRLTSFYNARNYQYAWFFKDGLTEQGLSFWSLYSYQLQSLKDSADKM